MTKVKEISNQVPATAEQINNLENYVKGSLRNRFDAADIYEAIGIIDETAAFGFYDLAKEMISDLKCDDDAARLWMLHEDHINSELEGNRLVHLETAF